jgi:tetratricopeptide (TPR) repeat protein
MPATRKMRTKVECMAHAFNQRSLRRSFAFVLGLGLSATFMEPESFAQYPSGDLPASPWSSRGENLQGRRADDVSRASNTRLRQPSSTQNETAIDLRAADASYGEVSRPAPVILMGPMAPASRPQSQSLNLDRSQDSSRNSRTPINLRKSSLSTNSLDDSNQTTALPSHALTQKKPIDEQSDWHRVQAGGIVLESEDARLADRQSQDFNESPAASSPKMNRRMGSGLPDRDDSLGIDLLPSQMASAKSSIAREQPIHLKSPNPIIEKEVSEPDLNQLTQSQASPSKPNVASTRSRSEAVLQLDAPSKVATQAPLAPETLIANNPKTPQVVKALVPTAESTNGSTTNNSLAVDEYQIKKFALAQRVSHELLSNTPSVSARAPEALESLPGWQSVERELKQRLERCDTLLKRGVILSAREEASQGLLRLYRTMDLHRGGLYSEPAFEKALVALREEQDFQKSIRSGQGISVQAVVDTHATEALKNRPLESTSPEMASMHYRWYARYQLITASDGHPWAADLLYAYGKTLEKEAELNPARMVMLRSQAVVCYQAATQIAPAQSDAANQLGYALIHLDRMDDAYAALTASIQNKPNANAWNNLAEVFRRLGKSAEAEYAVQQASALESTSPQYTAQNPEITEVDPAVFAKYSPVPTMVGPSQNFPANSLQPNVPNGNAPNVPVAKTSKSFFSKFLPK